MFTGIIEEIGTVSRVTPGASSLQLAISCRKVLSDVNKGDSISDKRRLFDCLELFE